MTILDDAEKLFAQLAALPVQERIDTINALRQALHQHSPLRDQPIDCVLWVDAETVHGNAYNPNSVAPPEMRLLERSIEADGFTQPIVTWRAAAAEGLEVVDGFHRHLVGKGKAVARRLHGRLPVTVANADRTDLPDRMASTIRHNRARGEHRVEGMSEIVVELARRGKTDEWIGTELGMDADEVRRLRQVGGIAEMFADDEFSEAWEADTWKQ
ncbi:ParB/RepB/Spo0J family partition protein [Mycobacterium sp. 155]|uniref:IbrB-like domain-containing protein n=1 Tax=Mycobacterium sp. 155 TaxID=1157943 RepID=UPI0003786F33|nr:ParB/RepB/Spo0J family partition protein [Mycobacterium sp. 155]